MVYFTDDFERATEDPLASEGWQVAGIKLQFGGIFASSAGGFCFQSVFADKDQHVRCSVAGLLEATDAWVEVLVRLDDSVIPSSFLPVKGYIVRLTFDVAGVRTLAISKWNPLTGLTREELATMSPTLEQSNGSDIAVIQDLRVLVDTVEQSQVRVRVYLNQLDDESPTLEHVDRGRTAPFDAIAYPTYNEPGFIGLFFGGQSNVAVSHFEAEDRAVDAPPIYGEQLTAKDVIDNILQKLDRSSDSGISRAVILQWVEDGMTKMSAELGYNSWFWRRNEIFAMAADEDATSTGRAIAPRRIRFIEEVRYSTEDRRRVQIEFLGHDDSGRGIYYFPNNEETTEYEFTYYVRVELPLSETSDIPIPRDFMQALVQCSLEEAVKYHADLQLEASVRVDSARWLDLCRLEADRLRMQNRGQEVLRGIRRSRAVSNILPPNQFFPFWPRR